MHIRDGHAADSATCWTLYQSAVREGAAPHYTEEQRRAWAPDGPEPEWIAERLISGTTWIAEEDGHALGFLTATGLPGGAAHAAAPPTPHLDLFFVRPDQRRKGVAAKLYDVFEAAVGQGGAAPRLTTFASLLLCPFLERRGWIVLHEEWAERSGVQLNRFAMEKTLSP